MSIYDFLIQLIGYIGLLCAVIAFQCKKHKNVMIFRTLNEMLFAVQYVFLGSYTGCVMNIIGSVRNMTFAKQVEKGKSTRKFQIIFSFLFFALGMCTYNGFVSILVIIAKVVTTFAYSLKNTRYIRLLTIPTSTCWLIYNFYTNSTAGILCEAFTLISIISAIIRIDIIETHKIKKDIKTSAWFLCRIIVQYKS